MKDLAHCSRNELITIIEQQNARIAALESQVARLSKDSTTSSKPPSSDIVKPPKGDKGSKGGKGGGKRKKKIGGQPGHPKHEREPFGCDEIDKSWSYELTCCPDCGGSVRPASEPDRVIQQVELIERPIEVVEHRGKACWCAHCGKLHYAPLPEPVKQAGLVGPQLTALVAYLKSVCHASFSTIRKFLRDVLKVTISRGQLAKVVAKASEALAGAYEQLRMQLPQAARLNVDETGHKDNGQTFWTWCFRAELFTLFKIDPSRGSQVLIDMLGEEFNGVLGCDYFSAYRKYMDVFDILLQFCLAHLIRDVKYLTTLPDKVTRGYGERLLEALRKLFGVIHRRESMTELGFARSLEQARKDVLAVAKRAPNRSEAQNLAKRFRLHGEAYFRFITTPNVDPTNNIAEQALRFVVIDRRITQGTRSETGRRWCERIWTVIATCMQQGRSVYTYLQNAILAHLNGQPPPPLIPAGP